MFFELINEIKKNSDAKTVVVQSDDENNTSKNLLLFCEFVHDNKNGVFTMYIK